MECERDVRLAGGVSFDRLTHAGGSWDYAKEGHIDTNALSLSRAAQHGCMGRPGI